MSEHPRPLLMQAVRHLKKALPEMSRRQIPATPQNYAVWYEYIAGSMPELTRAIDARIAAQLDFNDDYNAELYERFILPNTTSAVNSLQYEVRKLIDELLAEVHNSGSGLAEYGQVLERCASRIESETSILAVKGLITELVDETRKQEASMRSMKSSLDSMQEEIQLLRREVEKLNAASTSDPLTRAANRAAFDAELTYAAQKSNTDGSPLCLIIADIDHFKHFNDQFGHLTGDKVLKFVASLIKQNTKGQDMVARFGGEEFAVILPATEYDDACKVAEHIRNKLATHRLTDSTENRQLGTITLSAGVARYRAFESTDTLIHRADECLYAAKHAGRNRVLGEKDIQTQF